MQRDTFELKIYATMNFCINDIAPLMRVDFVKYTIYYTVYIVYTMNM